MKIFKDKKSLDQELNKWRLENPSLKLGFIATMGALHEGHMTLIHEAKIKADFVIATIFVNPTQFNEISDLEKYPRTVENDIKLLESNKCDFLFLPSVEEMYPTNEEPYTIDFKGLDKGTEGAYRDNHFEGVCMIVEKFLRIIKPDSAFFGIKDFQQVAIVKYMVNLRQLPVEVVAVQIKRAESGLALSSRNARLSEEEKEAATIIYKTLVFGRNLIEKVESIDELRENMLSFFEKGDLELEYLEIVNHSNLLNATNIQVNISCCIAAYCGKVRLIDNLQLM